MRKQDIRKIIRRKREELNKEIKKELDLRIMNNFFQSGYIDKSNVIFIYVNMDSEINTVDIITKLLEMGKRVAVPKVIPGSKEMVALEIKSLSDLNESGAFGILEPDITKKNVGDEVDLIILPGLAFDKRGYRIGYGGGFYDRFLEKYNKVKRLSLCYNFQIIENIPEEDFDEAIDTIITEDKIVKIN
ncbi:MAG: 5-formyltetrahydrofolate cyclo-ligase [Clostridium perfringens]|nr:5-formyltetrahydrofolate cyclo-ligase [Clostridium perfringens]